MLRIRELQPEDYGSFVRCYQQVFGGPPWNEQWSEEAVLEMVDSKHQWWVALDGGEVVAFAAGELTDALALGTDLGVDPSCLPVGKIGYQADIGVLCDYRGSGVARELAKVRHGWFGDRGADFLILRTKPTAGTFGWFTKKGYKIIFQYPNDTGQRLLIASPFADVDLCLNVEPA